MSANKHQPVEPTVTRIPLPVSETAMVIDLPDGQKLVVGKMSHGTVIEVATWRGTGRPDSRTNRMMLGLSSSEAEAEAKLKEELEKVESPQPSTWEKFWLPTKKVLVWLFLPSAGKADAESESTAQAKRQIKIKTPKISKLVERKSKAGSPEEKESEGSELFSAEFEVADFLESIKEQAAKAPLEPAKKMASNARKAAPRKTPARATSKKKASSTKTASTAVKKR